MSPTPGPWAATTRRGSWDWVVYQQANPNIEVCQPFHDGTEFNETGEANARLIATAPELLDALKSLLAVAETKQDLASWEKWSIEEASNLIKRLEEDK